MGIYGESVYMHVFMVLNESVWMFHLLRIGTYGIPDIQSYIDIGGDDVAGRQWYDIFVKRKKEKRMRRKIMMSWKVNDGKNEWK